MYVLYVYWRIGPGGRWDNNPRTAGFGESGAGGYNIIRREDSFSNRAKGTAGYSAYSTYSRRNVQRLDRSQSPGRGSHETSTASRTLALPAVRALWGRHGWIIITITAAAGAILYRPRRKGVGVSLWEQASLGTLVLLCSLPPSCILSCLLYSVNSRYSFSSIRTPIHRIQHHPTQLHIQSLPANRSCRIRLLVRSATFPPLSSSSHPSSTVPFALVPRRQAPTPANALRP